jgi:predicted CopG family antitoxin
MNHLRQAKSFTISDEVLREIANTKGACSTSERVNELLKRALELERRERLEQEAAKFFANAQDDVREKAAFQKASKEVLSRG